MRRKGTGLAGFAFFVSGVAAEGGEPVYLGVLENATAVRVAFRYRDGRWSGMPHEAADLDELGKLAASYPARITWTVSFDGRRIGEVTTTRPAKYERYSDAGLEALTPDSKAPSVRAGAAAFATWLGVPRNRPLVATSRPNYRDPDGWKPFRPGPEMEARARLAFRNAIALDPECKNRPTYNYPDSLLKVLDKGYRSLQGHVLIAVQRNPARPSCDESGEEWQSVWFLAKDGAPRMAGSDLTLLDAGDYDGDGASELLFQRSGYNRDGYLLLHTGDLSKQEFSWSYQ